MPVISGGSGGGAAFNGGTITNALTVNAPTGHDVLTLSTPDGFGTILLRATGLHTSVVLDGDGGYQLNGDDGAALGVSGTGGTEGQIVVGGASGSYGLYSDIGLSSPGSGGVPIPKGLMSTAITAGALPTTTFVSGTGKQIDTNRDVVLVVPCTLNPTAGAAGTVKAELSPDNTTYSTLVTITEPAGVALDGTIIPASLQVPAAWYVKLTATNATIGTGTYY